jgi:hypothetical protein
MHLVDVRISVRGRDNFERGAWASECVRPVREEQYAENMGGISLVSIANDAAYVSRIGEASP